MLWELRLSESLKGLDYLKKVAERQLRNEMKKSSDVGKGNAIGQTALVPVHLLGKKAKERHQYVSSNARRAMLNFC